MPSLKKIIKKTLLSLGLDVRRAQKESGNRYAWLKQFDIKTVFDIGASKGNASREFRTLFPDATIYAFEPLADCFAIMNENLKDLQNVTSYNLALSDSIGTTTMFRSSYSGSSSLRPMGQLHKTAFPKTAGQSQETITTDTLDHIASQLSPSDGIFIKIDVQGFEDKVIAGGQRTLARARIVVLEVSYVSLYDGQPLFDSVYTSLTKLGFHYAGLWGEDFRNPQDGQPLQQDAIFIRSIDV